MCAGIPFGLTDVRGGCGTPTSQGTRTGSINYLFNLFTSANFIASIANKQTSYVRICRYVQIDSLPPGFNPGLSYYCMRG